jgi:hypothetical protein
VALVPDEQTRSSDVIASGMIERIAMPEGLAERLVGAGRREQVNLYAQAGIWYDALAVLSELLTEERLTGNCASSAPRCWNRLACRQPISRMIGRQPTNQQPA